MIIIISWSCHFRLLCLCCHISFRRPSVYTHGHVDYDCCVCVVISFRRPSVYTHSHVVWDCCVCVVISHSGDRVFICTVMSFETVVFVLSYLIQVIRSFICCLCCFKLCLWFIFETVALVVSYLWCHTVYHSGNCVAAGDVVWDAIP